MNTEKEVKTSEVVSVMVGRVRFEGIIKETKVINLICEECENDFAVLKCMQCDQVISSPPLSLSTSYHTYLYSTIQIIFAQLFNLPFT